MGIPPKKVSKQQTKPSVRTNTGKAAVAPINTIKMADVNAGTKKINQWLKQNTGGVVDLDILKSVAGALPVIGNIISLTDAVYDVIEITKKPNPGFPDWLNLGIDIIGVIPIPPGLAASRMALRPALKVLKSKNLAKEIPDAIIDLLMMHVNEKVAGELDKFAEKAQPLINEMVDSCGKKGKELGNNFADGMSKLLNGQLFDSRKDLKNAKSSFSKMSDNIFRDSGKAFDHGIAFLRSGLSVVGQEYGNTTAKAATTFIGADTKAAINKQVGLFRKFSNAVPAKLAPLAEPSTTMSVAWMLQKLTLAAKKFKQKKAKKTVAIKPNQTSQKDKKRPNGELETIQNQKGANNNPNDNCQLNTTGVNGSKSKPVTKTKKSITYALGTEYLTHVDAFEFALSSFVLSRTYASNLYQLDEGEFGARWLTPFMTRIINKTEYVEETEQKEGYIHKLKGFQYIGADARPIALADIKIGESIHDQQEGFYYSIISENVQMISFGTEEKHIFEKNNDEYRLSTIEYKNGMIAAVRYDHKINDKSYISDILIKHKSQLLLHIAFSINNQGKVEDVWSIEKGELKRPLASYNYNEKGDLVEAITESGASYHYEYDHHLITRYTDLTGRGINLEYDGIEPTSKAYHEWADDGSSEVRLEWDENIRLTYVIDAYGNETEYYYDINGYTYRIVYPNGLEEWYFRDECSRVVRHIDIDAAINEYEFDENGNLTTITQPDGATVYYDYDDQDQLIGMVDAEQGRWFKEYDGSGNIIKEIDPLKRETKYNYNGMGLPTQITDAKGGSKRLEYDGQGNLISYTDCSGKESKWEYDLRGRVVSVENALKNKIEYFYSDFTTEKREPLEKGLPLNSFGQLERIKYSDALEEHFIHDAEGRLLVYIDPTGKKTCYDYNSAGLISYRIDPQGYKIKYEWDKLNRLKRLINENGAAFEFFYDVIGRLTKEIDFDGKETIYEYDEANGQLQTSIEVAMLHGQNLSGNLAPKDRIQHFVMDSMGRLEQRTSGFGYKGQNELEEQKLEEFAYNSHSQILLAKNAESKVEWFYDVVGNLVREHIQDNTTCKTAVWKHSYDEINDRIKTIRPDGQNVDWLTYGTGHVHSLILNGHDIVSFERDDLHRETARHYANGLSQFEQYDEQGRLSQQQIVKGHENGYAYEQLQLEQNAVQDTASLLSRVYRYDKSGQLAHIQDSRRGDIYYKYDPLGRLFEATSKLGKEKFSFDPASNLIDRDIDQQNHIHERAADGNQHGYLKLVNNVVRQYLDQQYQYDAYGQLTTQKSTQGDLDLSWDVLGRLVRSRNSEYTAEYRYDAMGRRLAKRSKHHRTGQEQDFVYGWDGDTLAYESNELYTKHYIYEKDSFIPLIQAVYQAPIQNHTTPVWDDKYSFNRDPLWKKTQSGQGFDDIWFYHCDHLGTPQELSDLSGQIIWKAQYKAWGECKAEKVKSNFFENSEIISNNIRFQGQYFDEETGLHYNRHRYYSPYVGRFISKDPIGLLGGHNVYAYAPNPVEWVDPRGLSGGKGSKNGGGKGSKGGVPPKKKPCPGNPCEGKDPSKTARSWQGSAPYSGVDAYKNVVVKKGTVLYTLYPHGNAPGNYLATSPDVIKAGTARGYNDAVQVAHTGNWDSPKARDMRTQLHAFIVTKDTCMAKGRTAANPHLGAGGGTQYFIENSDKKNLTSTGKIIKYGK
ncbi:RHS domain-containing protein [Acinetobacter sp. I-MWF]|uniref:RHS repeat-associated core domain-containing protein n=1 Tax=Acinetobacter sp. I-MWF TaxID=2940517 RepID=UPI0021CA3711|nr:RHS repeat-associated core domain-containing protein [Acinetobacter sp. I-MWF]MCT9979923.1 RHS domain-containing protein [Acinetobacter sp. I-MWF]